MRSRNEGFVQGWNAQAAVDDAHQIVVACDLSADPTDTRALPDLVDQVERNLGRRPKRALADAGYYSDANLDHLAAAGIDPSHDAANGTRTRGPFEQVADRRAMTRLEDEAVRRVLETEPRSIAELFVDDAEQYEPFDAPPPAAAAPSGEAAQ